MSITGTKNISWMWTGRAGMSKWTLTGTARDGRRLEVRGCDFYTFRDGQVTRKDSYWKITDGT